ncbi:retrovirus-related pol polyprotein from transposon TNT 1-94 [Tanacetum coccineum]
MNMGQDRQIQMVRGTGGNQFRHSESGCSECWKSEWANVVPGITNQNPNGTSNVVAAQAEVRPRRRDATYLQTQLLIAQKEEAGIQLQVEEFDLMAATADLDEIEEVNAKCILMANLQQGSTSEERYTELLEPIPEPHQVQKNDSNVISEVSSMEQNRGTVDQHPITVEETRAYFESLYNNLAIKVEKDNSETLQLAQESRQKMKQLNKEIKPANYTKINHLSGIFVSQTAKSQEEVYVVNTSKTATVSKSISKPNEEFLDDTTLSVARKFLNEVKSTIVTLQRVVKHRMTLDTHNWSSSAHQEIHKILKEEIFPIINQVDSRLQNFEIQFLKEAAKFVRDFKSLAKEADESLAKHKTLELEIERLLRAVVSQDIMSIVQNPSVVDSSNLQTELDRTKEPYNDMQQKIKRLQAHLGDQKGKSKDTPCVSNTLDPLSQKLENENVELEFQFSEQKDTTKGTSVNTQFSKQSILEKPPSSFKPKLYAVTPFPKSKSLPKIDKTHALSKPVTSNSVPAPQESKVVKNDKVIAPRMFRINPFKPSREDKYVPNKVRASVRINPITISQPHVITKKDVNSDSNGLSSIGIDNTTKTRRPQPRSNTKNDRGPSASKSIYIKNKEVEVEEHPCNLLLSKNKKHMSSECNHVKLVIQNDKSKVVCALCKQYLITANHDKQKPKVTKPKKVGSNERLALPKPSKPRSCLRWSPTGRLFDLKGKIIASSESESQSDCSNGDNAWCSKHMIGNLKLLINFFWKFLGTIRFGNDHVAAILGFGDLQWGNILITKVYFVEGLRHNLFSVRKFCDSDLEVAFRRNTCFIRNLAGVDLLKGNRTTNLYTINLHDMASASPICLMARTTSTKSWLWHQRLSHLNFDTINDLAKNNLVTGLPKFKYYKEHLCPSCKQGKSKRASHPPKPVPNSKQRLHLLHTDLRGPMRIASINGKRYVLVIVDDYSRYTWVVFQRSKDEAPEEIKTFLKRIIVQLQAPVIIVRTDNGTEFKNQVLQEYFKSVGISHQASSVRNPQQNGLKQLLLRATLKTAPSFTVDLTKHHTSLLMAENRISHFFMYLGLSYPKNDREDIGKLGAKAMAFEQRSLKPRLQSMTSGQISSGLDLPYALSTITTQRPTKGELDLLFEAMYDDHVGGQPSSAPITVQAAQAPQVLQTPTATITTADTAPTPTNSFSLVTSIPSTSQNVDELKT